MYHTCAHGTHTTAVRPAAREKYSEQLVYFMDHPLTTVDTDKGRYRYKPEDSIIRVDAVPLLHTPTPPHPSCFSPPVMAPPHPPLPPVMSPDYYMHIHSLSRAPPPSRVIQYSLFMMYDSCIRNVYYCVVTLDILVASYI